MIRNLKINKRILSFIFAIGLTFAPFLVKGDSVEKNSSGQYVLIFSDDNIHDSQYGASQKCFASDNVNLLCDDLIWNELQNYFPVSEFENTSAAKDFYIKYFQLINQGGCGYAVAANIAFKAYEGRKEEFERIFGYPMYKRDCCGNVDFNYELFIL
jgi:hypothetical protein